MALTRKLLKGLGLTEEQMDTIIDAHTETVDGLKAERDGFKADAEKLADVQRELDDIKKDGWKGKYETEKAAHETLKQEIADKETRAAKIAAYRQLLTDENISEKRIDTVIKASAALIDSIELDKDGKPIKADELKQTIKTEWSDFVVTTKQEGAKVEHPPKNTGGGKMTREDIYKKDEKGRYVMSTAERQKALADNPELLN